MKIIVLLRLLWKNIVLLMVAPLLMALIVVILTWHAAFTYSSGTILYTGIASGTSVELDKSFSFFANNTAFDNLINIIKSRGTEQEVAVRLLAQHLMLDHPDPKYISLKSFTDLKKITPSYIRNLVVKNSRKKPRNKYETDTAQNYGDKTWILQPPNLDPVAYEQTVKNLMEYTQRNDTNFVYSLLNFKDPHYSIEAISSVKVERIASSDLVQIQFESDDPGICQQTLAILTGVCLTNYKNLKENRSDAVVKYFENQVSQASGRLTMAEDKLLKFNEDNNIINYYEQSKAVANVKEDLDVDYNDRQIKLAGFKAAIKHIEEKLKFQKQIQLNNTEIIDKRDRLAEVNFKIANAEIGTAKDSIQGLSIEQLKLQAETLKDDIRTAVNELAKFGTSTEGIPINSLLNDWIDNVLNYEEAKAGIDVLAGRIKSFQKQYAAYAPAGANLKRIEREISVSEQEFLELLHGLNLAKLKMQDAELSSNIKAVDLPYYPLSPNPTKRSILIIIAALLGFLIVFANILVMEYFDDTLKNSGKASKLLKLKSVGVFPKIFLKSGLTNFPITINRLLEITLQQINALTQNKDGSDKPYTLLFFSSLSKEGKTVTAGNIAWKLKKLGKKILFFNFLPESLRETESNQIGFSGESNANPDRVFINSHKYSRFLNRMLGYPDSRIDPNSPFLQNPDNYLESKEYMQYRTDADYFSVDSFRNMIKAKTISSDLKLDYVILEIPPILNYSFPTQLVASVDLPILVCRANRVWTPADQKALDTIAKITSQEPVILLNGVELQSIESILGELPKKRSRFRRMLKRLVRFQFYSKNQI